MSQYFVVRSSTNPDAKKWILSEIRAGRLRQGWFANKRSSLVDKTGGPVAERAWTSNFQKVVREWVPKPTTNKEKRYRTAAFAREKYRELKQMLDIPEGARLIVPKLDADGGEEGFVLARAARAPGGKRPARGCYWFDGEKRPRAPHDDYRHVVEVDPESVRIIPRGSSGHSRQIHEGLETREKPVIHSRNEDFNKAIERLYASRRPPTETFKGEPASGTEERQARGRIKAEIMRRRGQPKFRQDLLDAYGRCCAISGCDAEAALEAAHIRTYKGADLNHMRNGILLRADLHTLFDLGLICVRTSTWKVIIAPELKGTSYESLNGKSVRLPASEKLWPSKALDYHRQKVFNLRS